MESTGEQAEYVTVCPACLGDGWRVCSVHAWQFLECEVCQDSDVCRYCLGSGRVKPAFKQQQKEVESE